MKRAHGFQDGEIVDWNENPEAVREEVLRRNVKAGYCTKGGEPVGHTKIISQPSNDKYRKNYVKIFGHD